MSDDMLGGLISFWVLGLFVFGAVTIGALYEKLTTPIRKLAVGGAMVLWPVSCAILLMASFVALFMVLPGVVRWVVAEVQQLAKDEERAADPPRGPEATRD